MGRRTAPLVIVAVMLAAIATPLAARASSSQEEDFVSRINAERTSRGIPAVSPRSDLTDVARRWSGTMASAGQIWHDPNLPNEISGWTALGDNVGRGPSVSDLHQAFMNSPEHRSIILDPTYNQVGVGVVQSGNTLYVTEVFVRRTASEPRHTVRRSTTATSRAYTQTGPSTYVLALTGVVWEIDLGDDAPLTVSVLEQLAGLDAPSVDPATGNPV